MYQPIFYFKKLGTWDKWTVSLYAFLTLFVFAFVAADIDYERAASILLGYTISTHFFLYFINYRSLRNFAVYLIWLGFGTIHFLAFLVLKADPSYQLIIGGGTIGLRNTIFLLILFQVLRILSLNLQGQEFVAVSRSSKTDLFDERKINMLDFGIFVIYAASAIVLWGVG